MIRVEDLIQSLSEEQVLETFLRTLETLGLPARSWRPAGALRSILRVLARTFAGFTELMAAFIRAGFLETAEYPWLKLLALHVYGVEAREATFATGRLQFINEGGGVYSFGPDEVRAISPATKRAYANAEAFTLGPGETKVVAIRAVEVGSASSAPPGAITELETVLLKVVVTNPEAVVGRDEEPADELRQRCRDQLGSLSLRGPRGAYATAVRRAKRADGSAVDINRLSVSPSSSTGTVTIYVASPGGAPAQSDIDAIRESVENIARPDAVEVSILPATEVPLARAITVWARRHDGVAAGDIKAVVEAALIGEVSAYPIGGIPKPPNMQGYLYADFIAGAAKATHTSIYDVDGIGDDIPLNPGDVATLATTVAVRIVEVP